MEDLFRFADDLGPDKIVHITEPATGLKAVVVVDNAPCHRRKDLNEIPGLSLVFLPPYAPELNPAERFFEEIRRATANTIFSELDDIEAAITKAVNRWANNTRPMRQLLGYTWIHEQRRELI